MTKTQIKRKLEKINERLGYYYEKEKALLTKDGVQSYTIGPQTVSRYQYTANILSQIEQLEKERDNLENLLSGSSAHKSVAVVPRDW